MASVWTSYNGLWAAVGALPAPVNDRRFRLWVIAGCRLVLDRCGSHPRLARARTVFNPANVAGWDRELTAAEDFADGKIDERKMRDTRNRGGGGPHHLFRLPTGVNQLNPESASRAFTSFGQEFGVPAGDELLDLLRDLFAHPRATDPVPPEWLTPTVVALADAIYAGRAWDRMPVLADALEDAGCADPRVLGHCRGPGPHARGCWVVDGILGKS